MNDEFAARQRAITFRLAGRPVKQICSALGRTEAWFHKWWRRYLEAGVDGLFDLTRARHVNQQIPPELERAILSIRRRLQAHASPATRYSLIGATAILAELKGLDIRPLPSPRTVERVLQRHGLTTPRERLPRLLPRQVYPAPQAQRSNQLHEVDPVGPIYLKGRKHRYYILVCKNAFDGAVCSPSRSSSTTPARSPAGVRRRGTCRGSSGCACGTASRRGSSRRHGRSTTAASRTSTAGSSRGCSNAGSRGRATCGGSWHAWRRRSTRSTFTRGWGA